MTKQEIINEIANFYNLGNRATNNGFVGCYYISTDGKMCGVGRCVIDPILVDNYTSGREIGVLSGMDEEVFNNLFKEEYRGHDYLFWQYIQNLHDSMNYWNNTGLSNDGFKQVNFLLEKYQYE